MDKGGGNLNDKNKPVSAVAITVSEDVRVCSTSGFSLTCGCSSACVIPTSTSVSKH